MTVNEIYLEIGQNIYNLIEDDEFLNATLKIERQDKYVGYNGYYFNIKNERKYLDVRNLEINSDSIHELHAITTEGGHNRWNKLEFTLYPDFKFNLEFIWDQEWQDEVDGYNNNLKT